MSINFGSSTPKPATGFALQMTNPTSAAPTTGFSLTSGAGDNKTPQNKPATNLFGTQISNPTFSFGGEPPKSTATAAPTLNFGAPAASSAAPVSQTLTLGSTAPTSAAPPLFGLGTSTAGATPASTAGSLFAPIGSAATSSTGIALGSLGTTPSTAASSVASTTSLIPSSIPTAATSAAAAASVTAIPQTGALSFAQLEDNINKWTIDLEEQGKFFVNQAKQLNAWDSLLISNGEKILNLNGSIERVKQQQQQLDQELDFVLAQQKELEELITPLEKELIDIPVTDGDRSQMYQLSEIIDSQLKQMSDDLKEIIEHINESNKNEEMSNPVTQISRILNAHMNSLQWIDRNTAQISGQLEQLNKLQDTNRRNITFNQSLNMS